MAKASSQTPSGIVRVTPDSEKRYSWAGKIPEAYVTGALLPFTSPAAAPGLTLASLFATGMAPSEVMKTVAKTPAILFANLAPLTVRLACASTRGFTLPWAQETTKDMAPGAARDGVRALMITGAETLTAGLPERREIQNTSMALAKTMTREAALAARIHVDSSMVSILRFGLLCGLKNLFPNVAAARAIDRAANADSHKAGTEEGTTVLGRIGMATWEGGVTGFGGGLVGQGPMNQAARGANLRTIGAHFMGNFTTPSIARQTLLIAGSKGFAVAGIHAMLFAGVEGWKALAAAEAPSRSEWSSEPPTPKVTGGTVAVGPSVSEREGAVKGAER